MEAKELMIGDYVYLVHNEDGVAPYNEPKQWSKDDYEYTEDYIATCFEPIPLTPEILKKNRYQLMSEDDEDDWVDEPTTSMFGCKDGGYDICIDSTILTVSGHIDYVHQLQHILRLCGITKEIII